MKYTIVLLIMLSCLVYGIENILYNGVDYQGVGFDYNVTVSTDIISVTNYTSLGLDDGIKYSSGVWLSDCYYDPNIECFVNTNTSLTECGQPLYPCLAEVLTGLPICITVIDFTPSLEDFLNDCFSNYSEQIYYDGWFNYQCSEDLLNVSDTGIINDLTFRNHCDPEYLGTGFNSGYDVCNKSLFHYVIQENSTNNETVFSKAYIESFSCESVTTTTTTASTTTTTSPPETTTTSPPETTTTALPETTTTNPESTTTTTLNPENYTLYNVIAGNGTPVIDIRGNVSQNETLAEGHVREYVNMVTAFIPLIFLLICLYGIMNNKTK